MTVPGRHSPVSPASTSAFEQPGCSDPYTKRCCIAGKVTPEFLLRSQLSTYLEEASSMRVGFRAVAQDEPKLTDDDEQ